MQNPVQYPFILYYVINFKNLLRYLTINCNQDIIIYQINNNNQHRRRQYRSRCNCRHLKPSPAHKDSRNLLLSVAW